MYTATITRNFRDVQTTVPKVLLLNIIDDYGNEFRDHCWVTLSHSLEKFIPYRNKTKLIIRFEAKVKEYQTYDVVKKTLASVKNIILLKKIIQVKNLRGIKC